MNALKNRVQLIGNLGQAPVVKLLDNGKKVARMSIAINESYKNGKGENMNDTYWHTIVAWGKTAEIAEKFLVKGSEVAIEGKLVSRVYTTNDGQKRYITEVVANELLLLTRKAS
ncbi:MAG: single-stranded DNA-binding protein [Chitinophagaceae bacterium]|jgi:single-strand DNA-binding protein|nr:single-stranded DNA-binding protein [Chitinophagaceae bacterium]